MCKQHVRACFMKFLGANMVIFSPVTIALGAGNVYLAVSQSCTPLPTGCALTIPVILTWVGIGIWAPLPIFINGIGSIYMANKPAANGGVLCLLSFLNTLIFAPALSVITGFELYYKFFFNGISLDAVPKLSEPYKLSVFGIESSIAGLGAVLWLHTLAILYLSCCCGCTQPDTENPPSNDSAGGKVSAANPNKARQDPAKKPAKDETDRMKLWSAVRSMTSGGKKKDEAATAPAASPTVYKSTYYAVGARPPTNYSGCGVYANPRLILTGASAARW